MHWTYCGMPKCTSWVEAMSSSEKIKPIALENSIKENVFKISWQLFESISG